MARSAASDNSRRMSLRSAMDSCGVMAMLPSLAIAFRRAWGLSAVQAAASVRHRWCRRGPLNIDHPRELEQRIGRGEPLHFRQKLSPSTVTQSNERRPGIVQSRYRRATGSKHLRDA